MTVAGGGTGGRAAYRAVAAVARLVNPAPVLHWNSDKTYLADLAVDVEYQNSGIGRALIAETRARLKRECMIVLLAAPLANAYYAKVGFEHHPRAWVMQGELGQA